MVASRRNWFAIVLAFVGCGILIIFVLQIAFIQLRLWRNGAIAGQLVEALGPEFPGVHFSGGASYQQEIVYITAVGGIGNRKEIEDTLRRLKADLRITPAIWLRFVENEVDRYLVKL